MNANEWIALVGIALTGGTTLVIFAIKLGGALERIRQQETAQEKLADRVDILDAWRLDVSGDVKVMKALLENINTAVNARKTTT